MPLPIAPLLRALERARRATTRTQRQEAAVAFSAVAYPLLTDFCAAILRRAGAQHRQSAKDVASDTLLPLLFVPQRIRAFRATTAAGVMAWLCGVARLESRVRPDRSQWVAGGWCDAQ